MWFTTIALLVFSCTLRLGPICGYGSVRCRFFSQLFRKTHSPTTAIGKTGDVNPNLSRVAPTGSVAVMVALCVSYGYIRYDTIHEG